MNMNDNQKLQRRMKRRRGIRRNMAENNQYFNK
jgi:hypothetical protein